jgi:hypothetical protein
MQAPPPPSPNYHTTHQDEKEKKSQPSFMIAMNINWSFRYFLVGADYIKRKI